MNGIVKRSRSLYTEFSRMQLALFGGTRSAVTAAARTPRLTGSERWSVGKFSHAISSSPFSRVAKSPNTAANTDFGRCEDEMAVCHRQISEITQDSEWQLAAKEEGALLRPAAVHIGKPETESNVSAQTPPDLNDGDTTVDSIGEEVEDSIMNSQESPGNMSLSGRSPEITDSLGQHDVAANTTTSTSSNAGANSGGGVSRHMGRGAASVRPVALKRTVQKKTKQGQIIEQLTTKTLNLLDNSSKQDEHDKFGSLLADRV
ncbi:unnamed protein product [Ranitomeya imitator]|uniref:Uncharacterized protein n=1 Tax=Ranitomeya imitator TaxID=111125 RepID=A0ABN9MPF6_9NEOB|nr:unnamed protein product [Ranitomeya imitator]